MNASQRANAHFAGRLLAANHIDAGRTTPDGQVLDGVLPPKWELAVTEWICDDATDQDVLDIRAVVAEGYLDRDWPDDRTLEELMEAGLL